MVNVRDTQTGDILERHPVDAREMVAQADGRYAYADEAPPEPELLTDAAKPAAPPS